MDEPLLQAVATTAGVLVMGAVIFGLVWLGFWFEERLGRRWADAIVVGGFLLLVFVGSYLHFLEKAP